MLSWYFSKPVGWIRIGRWLLHWKHVSNKPLFSERYGHNKYTRIGFGYRINLSRDK